MAKPKKKGTKKVDEFKEVFRHPVEHELREKGIPSDSPVSVNARGQRYTTVRKPDPVINPTRRNLLAIEERAIKAREEKVANAEAISDSVLP